ncbi:MAG: hypothetical protein JO362_01850 [Streptomycetaceae bacterium]|nr:hypothetical protein [Streptomycetaceae bacterium]
MSFSPNWHASEAASALGFDGDPVPGEPRVLQGVVDDFTYLRDTAWSVSQGLDAFVASASGGFAGATADALREVVSGRLKTFVFNIARAFSLAGEAVAEYRTALVQAQQVHTHGRHRRRKGPRRERPASAEVVHHGEEC